jgi:hypothetical protein
VKAREANVPRTGVRRLLVTAATAAGLVVAVLGVGSVLATIAPGTGPASAATASTIGPAQISALGHPGLCWQAWGNGSPVTLAKCDATSQGQQWSLTLDGVMMNGNGYCLEAAAARGAPLFIDFAGQCGGGRRQIWRYHSGLLTSTQTGACAGLGGPLEPGTDIVRRSCPPTTTTAERAAVPRWSIGYSAVSVTPGTGSGTAGGTFTGSVTVANAASAQTAYGVTVRFALPPGSTAAGLRPDGGPDGGMAGWTCDLRSASCTGSLVAGTSGRIGLTGRLPAGARPGSSVAVPARASVTGTSQRSSRARTTASVTVVVGAPAPAPSPAGQPALPLVAAGAGVLLRGGGLLVILARRRRPRLARHRSSA